MVEHIKRSSLLAKSYLGTASVALIACGAARIEEDDGGRSTSLDASAPLRHDKDRLTGWIAMRSRKEVAERMAFAARNQLDLNVSVVDGEASSEPQFLSSVCANAAAHGVALLLWPKLPRAQGIWPNQSNVDAFVDFVNRLAERTRDTCPRLDGFVIDMETPIQQFDKLKVLREGGASDLDLAQWLLDGIDVKAFEAARTKYAGLVRRLHERGYTVALTTLPPVLDDDGDGDETISKALWTPIQGIDWDRVSFQVYRTLFDLYFPRSDGRPYTSWLVSSYAASALAQWGDKAGLDLGTTGGGLGFTEGLPNAAALQADIAAAQAAQIPAGRIAVFSIDELDGKAHPDAWVTVPEPRAPAEDGGDEQVRMTFGFLDLGG